MLDRLLSAGVAATFGASLAGCGGAPPVTSTMAPSPAPPPDWLNDTTVDIGGGMEFDCLQTTTTCTGDQAGDNVLLVHGFPLRKEFWVGLMGALHVKGFCALACDMHGYSPNASPDDKSKYQTDAIRADTFKIADTVGFATFHLIGHDHGALLGWRMATTDVPADLAKIKTYTAMSIPHIDVFSAALYGDEASEDQQVASQYFSAFVVEPKASTTFFDAFKCARYGSCFETAADFQKALWWYNGIFEGDGGAATSMPPDLTFDEIGNSTSPGKASALRIRTAFPELKTDGIEQKRKIGDVSKPTLYVCGSKDTSILCWQDWALKTEAFCKDRYEYLELNCGHDLDTCEEAEEKKMHTKVVAHLSSNSALVQF